MTLAPDLATPTADARRSLIQRPYRHAHWYLLGAFAVVFAGFWPTFYRPMASATTLIFVHGVTATLWYIALIGQAWLINRGHVVWHRRVAIAVIALLPILLVSALMTTQVMLAQSLIPPPVRPLIAWLDITFVVLFVVLFVLGLRNRHDTGAHMRYMVATALLGFPPAIGRFVNRTVTGVNGLDAINLALWLVEMLLVVLIVADWRAGAARRRAYPLALGWHVVVHWAMVPVSTSAWWLAFCGWFSGG